MQPNVLLLMIDALRADRCWGAERQCHTPVLEELIPRSTVFTQAFSTSSVTTVCTASLLTGSYPFVHGIHMLAGRPLEPNLPTMAEAFQAYGYHTWAEVTGPLLPTTGLNRGFNDYCVRGYKEWLDTSWGDYLMAKLKEDLPVPWFGFLHLWELHHPRRVTSEYDSPEYGQSLYDRAVSSLDNQLARLLEALPDDTIIIITGDHGEYVSESKSGEFVAELKRSFKWLKKRVPGVKKLKQVSPMILDMMGGLSSNKNDLHFDLLGHGYHIYDYLIHVPLIIYGPNFFPAGLKLSQPVSHVDVFPTLASTLDLHTADTSFVSGVDLMPFTQKNNNNLDNRPLYMEVSGIRTVARPELSLKGLRAGHYKYVYGLHQGESLEELYDLEKDPDERQNISNQFPDIAETMQAQITELMQSSSRPYSEEQAAYSSEEMIELQQRLQDLGYLD